MTDEKTIEKITSLLFTQDPDNIFIAYNLILNNDLDLLCVNPVVIKEHIMNYLKETGFIFDFDPYCEPPEEVYSSSILEMLGMTFNAQIVQDLSHMNKKETQLNLSVEYVTKDITEKYGLKLTLDIGKFPNINSPGAPSTMLGPITSCRKYFISHLEQISIVVSMFIQERIAIDLYRLVRDLRKPENG